MHSVQGRALVASPYLTDGNFLRAVVYILRHDEEGAVGLILNRAMNLTVGELLAQLTDEVICNDDPVYCGGPVDGPLMMLQACKAGSTDTESVLVASDQDRITSVCGESKVEGMFAYRIFEGYAGWGPNQLEEELKEGSWLLWDIRPEHIFSKDDELWQMAVREIGRDILTATINPNLIPADPGVN